MSRRKKTHSELRKETNSKMILMKRRCDENIFENHILPQNKCYRKIRKEGRTFESWYVTVMYVLQKNS